MRLCRLKRCILQGFFLLFGLILSSISHAWEVSGYVGLENLAFINKPLYEEQHQNYISGVIETELYHEWDNGTQSFAFVPYFRGSQHDSQRTHVDIRELTWLKAAEKWELRLGIRKVFWGVTESNHLVDVINQRDMVENSDGEDKLGQPMVNLALIKDWGTLDLFILPWFRERTFAGEEGRLRPNPAVNSSLSEYDKSGYQRELAYAVRWAHSMGNWDVGLSHFYGTSRAPIFLVEETETEAVNLIPYYQNINQTGLDIQVTLDSLLLKWESIVRVSHTETAFATTAGFEYSFFNIMSSGIDIGLLSEYLYDSRGAASPTLMQDDFFVGTRFALNDIQDFQLLAGIMVDRKSQAQFYNIEVSRRFFDSFKLAVEARFFNGASAQEPSYFLQQESHFRMELSYHF
jgi:hypothetical protein